MEFSGSATSELVEKANVIAENGAAETDCGGEAELEQRALRKGNGGIIIDVEEDDDKDEKLLEKKVGDDPPTNAG